MKIDVEDLKKELSCFPTMVKDPTSNEQDAITWHWIFLKKFEGFEKELRRKQGYPHHYHKNEYWIRIKELLGEGLKNDM